MSIAPNPGRWKFANADNFWKKIARSNHVLQIYENDGVFLDALTGFVVSLVHSDEVAAVIATRSHLNALEYRLESYGIDVEALISNNKFLPLDAEETLSEFMVNDWPNEILFKKTISELFGDNKKIRIFGEMVAMLWTDGKKQAAMELELLFNKLWKHNRFSLFCAYPKGSFVDEEINSINIVWDTDAKIISGSEKQLTHILYKEVA
jgi:hypothetical protein